MKMTNFINVLSEKDYIVALIVFLLVAVFIISLVIIFYLIKRKRIAYVLNNSSQLGVLKQINNKYLFDIYIDRKLKAHYFLNSKAKFDRFNVEGAIRQSFFDNQVRIKTTVEMIARYKILYRQYLQEISRIPVTDFDSLPKTKLLKKAKYYSLEKKLVDRSVKKPDFSLSMVVVWSYTSPAGRNHYEDFRELDFDKIVRRYFVYFGVNLSNVEYNDRVEQATRSVVTTMTNCGYSTLQIINLFKTFGIDADEKLAMTAAAKAGFTKNKNSDIYLKNTIGSVADMILCSSDSSGLIHYENSVKDEEYDKAIFTLEKERRIVPISNLLFLKLDKSLSYNGITLEEIKIFDKLVKKYSNTHLYISVKSIIDNIKCKVTESLCDKCFIYDLLKYCGFLHEIPSLEKVFTAQEAHPTRIKFLIYLVGENKSVNAFDLIQTVKDTYGVEYSIYSIIYDIDKNDTKLYYNNETEKLYLDKEYFYEEIL